MGEGFSWARLFSQESLIGPWQGTRCDLSSYFRFPSLIVELDKLVELLVDLEHFAITLGPLIFQPKFNPSDISAICLANFCDPSKVTIASAFSNAGLFLSEKIRHEFEHIDRLIHCHWHTRNEGIALRRSWVPDRRWQRRIAPHHILNTPKAGRSAIGASKVAANASPSTSRVCTGSITPSSHIRAVA